MGRIKVTAYVSAGRRQDKDKDRPAGLSLACDLCDDDGRAHHSSPKDLPH